MVVHPPGTPPVIGIVGGSGVYALDGLTDMRWRRVLSPFGEPSDDILSARLDGQPILFLPRHGRGHRVPPSELNYRANIDALKRAGATEILSISAVGSLREDLAPGCFVIVDQFIDRTFGRRSSFFEAGLVAHVSMADPVCARLGDAVQGACADLGIDHVRGGTYLAMEGPQFSTRAESDLHRAWGCAVIGMTNMPEAKLAREAELCYATIAMVTDYDCWHDEHEAVTVEGIVRVLGENAERARALVRAVVPRLAERRASCHEGCHFALDHAIVTDPAMRDPGLVRRLDAVAGRVLRDQG
jgi:5'-methylthioadenosine phosphorylase